MSRLPSSVSLACVLLVFALAAPARAGAAPRAFVSGHGTDAAGCGQTTNPCLTFQYAHNAILAAGGETDVLDAAGYGPVVITKSISIVNDGAGTAGIQTGNAGENGVTVNAGAGDTVMLRGPELDGLGVGGSGIVVNSAASVTIANCVVRHFGAGGSAAILARPSRGRLLLAMSDVVASDNGADGILVEPSAAASASGLLKRVTVSNNKFNGVDLAGGLTAGVVDMTIVDSAAVGDAAGFVIGSAPSAANAIMFLDNATANDNASAGVSATGLSVVRLTRSAIARNGSGVSLAVSGAGGGQTFGDNAITGNFIDVIGPLTPVSLR